jgi:hypothetical protein|mmetsp:Transcript_68990/g.153947  ORF Transcript_68990/g.153947 Transcript_68990/m.153947 type:complete len:82 (+) Transcript_68990:1059-1304(+)
MRKWLTDAPKRCKHAVEGNHCTTVAPRWAYDLQQQWVVYHSNRWLSDSHDPESRESKLARLEGLLRLCKRPEGEPAQNLSV